MLQVIRFFMERYRLRFSLAIVLSVASAAATVAVVSIVTRAIAAFGGPAPSISTGVVFVACVLSSVITRAFARNLLQDISASLTVDLRLGLARSILNAPYERIERIGAAPLTTSLHGDVGQLGASLNSVSTVVNNSIIVIGIFAYLAWLSPLLCLATIVTASGGIAGYWWLSMRGARRISRAQTARDALYQHLATVVTGLKELKLNQRRRDIFLSQDVDTAAATFVDENRHANYLFNMAVTCGQIFFFFIVGALVLGLPHFSIADAGTLASFAVMILYILAPLENSLNQASTFAGATAAIHRLRRLGLAFDTQASELSSVILWPVDDCPTLEMTDLVFTYQSASGPRRGFTVGPLNLVFRPGELTVVSGGNGSGKTTFAKLLTGLYVAGQGRMSLGSGSVDDTNRDRFYSVLSVAFVDSEPFQRLPGTATPAMLDKAQQYLDRFGLSSKVQLNETGFSTVTDLSKGEKQRLILLSMYLEDRYINVFDEWAANQDYEFKRLFYEVFLPEMRESGKILVVISHDLHFLHVADRVVWLEEGRTTAPPLELPLLVQRCPASD